MTECLNFKDMRTHMRLNLSRELDAIFHVQVGLHAQLLADNLHDLVDAQINEQIIWLINDINAED